MANLSGEAKQTYVADLFARIAGHYDLMNSLMTGGMHHRWKRITAQRTTEMLSGPALDIATGTGDLAFALARQPGIEPAVGVDLLAEMLALARDKKARKLKAGTPSSCRETPCVSLFPTEPLPAPRQASVSAICRICPRPLPKWRGSCVLAGG